MNQFAEVNLERLEACLRILAERADHARLRELFRTSFTVNSRRIPALFQQLADGDRVEQFVAAAEAAFRAAASPEHPPGHDHGPPLPALQVRYALILSSLPGHIRNVPPRMLARLIGEGVWTFNQAVTYVQQITDTAARTQRLAQLAGIAPDKDSELVHAVYIAALSCDPATDSGRKAVTAVLPLVQGAERHSLVEHLLSAGAPGARDRLSTLLACAEHLTETHLVEAEASIRTIGNLDDRIAALAELCPRLSAERQRELLAELLHQVSTPHTPAQRAILTTLLPHLDTATRDTMRARILSGSWWPSQLESAGGTVARHFFNFLTRARLPIPDLLVGFAMSLLLPNQLPVGIAKLLDAVADSKGLLPIHIVRRAAVANPDATNAFGRLVSLLTPFELRIVKRLMGRFLFDAVDSNSDGEGPDKSGRLAMDARLAASRHDEADASAQLATAEFLYRDGLLDNGSRIEIIDSLMPHLPGPDLPRAVALAQEHGDEPQLLLTLARYLEYLDENVRVRYIQKLIEHANRLAHGAPEVTAQLVATMATNIPEEGAARLLSIMEKIPSRWRSPALAALAPRISANRLPNLHQLLLEAPAQPETIEAVLTLASRSARPTAVALRARALEFAHGTGDRLLTARCLIPILRNPPVRDQLRTSIEILDLLKAEATASNGRDYHHLERIAATFIDAGSIIPAGHVVVAFDAASRIPHLSLRVEAWAGILWRAKERHRIQILREIVRSCREDIGWTDFGRILALAEIVGWLEEDEPTKTEQLYRQSQELSVPAHRALVLAEIARATRNRMLGQTASVAAAHEMGFSRQRARQSQHTCQTCSPRRGLVAALPLKSMERTYDWYAQTWTRRIARGCRKTCSSSWSHGQTGRNGNLPLSRRGPRLVEMNVTATEFPKHIELSDL